MNIIGMILGIILIASLYGGVNFYIGRRIFKGLTFLFPHINGFIYTGIYVFIALSLIFGYLPLSSRIKGIFNYIGSYWIGIFVYLLILFLARDLILFICSRIKIIESPISQSIRFCTSLIVVLLTICLVGYGILNASKIKHVSYDIQLKESVLTGDIKIVLISDLHLGAINSENRLERIVNNINDLKPDLVCIAGDIFDSDYNAIQNTDKAIELLKGINAKYGVYACLGNHDAGGTFNEMLNFLEQSNIKLLNDEYVIIDERFVLVGRLDSSPIGDSGELKRKDITETIASLNTSLPIIVMDHNPSNIDQYGGEVDLILSGHTHNGQIFPTSLITKAMFTVSYGHYRKDADSPHVIVTSGISTWGMPLRIGSDNEIVSILLH